MATELFDGLQPANYLWVSANAASGGDGSHDHPFNTIQQAVDLAGAGTAVMVTAGEYHENVQLPTHTLGTATAPTWLVSADGAGAAKILAPSNTVGAIYGYGTDNYVVNGFAIEGGKNGIQFSQSGSNFSNMVQNILVENNVIQNAAEDAIKIDQADNVQILGNTTHHNGQEGIDFVAVNNSLIEYNDVSDASGSAGIMVKGGSTNVTIAGNDVHDIPVADGILVGGWTGDQYFVPGFTGYESKNVTVIDNEVHNVAKRALNFLGAVDATATHNYLEANPAYYYAVNVDKGNPQAKVIAHSSNIVIDDNIFVNKMRLFVSTDSSNVSFHDNSLTGTWNTQTGPAVFVASHAIPVDSVAPVLLSASPAAHSVNAFTIGFSFDEAVAAGRGNILIHNAFDGSIAASIAAADISQVNFSGDVATLHSAASLVPGSHYYVTIDAGAVQDSAGNGFAGVSSSAAIDFTAASAVNTKATYDFDGNGNSDILLKQDSGQAAVWLMNGTDVIKNGAVSVDPAWKAIGAGDFNGDGKADILWQDASGQAEISFMNGTDTITSHAAGSNPGSAWHAISTGDFDGDGKSDILWQNDSGQAAVWLMNGAAKKAGTSLAGNNPGPSWHAIGAGDFNGDGKSDILWQNDSGQAAVWLMNGSTETSHFLVGANPGTSWHVKGAGDFNGDGKSDILWQDDHGQMQIWLMNGKSVLGTGSVGSADPLWHAEGIGDFNGDGKADILMQNDSGQAAVLSMNGTSVLAHDIVSESAGPAWHIDWA
ncbi:MAG TPA: FG-GAP-like repeat-containing protein [Micropepsaceae bacterium]|jgi:hypothetical protein|nr:FG-GAP-like repeat-containing protein [Micropepsaceae bacterium]